MATNNLDKTIKEKLQERTFQPSASAWERLSIQLDEQPTKKKKGWFFYIGIAASILLIISVGILGLSDSKTEKPFQEIVKKQQEKTIEVIDTKDKIDKLIKEIPVEEALVKVDESKEKKVLPVLNDVKIKQKNNRNTERITIAKVTPKPKENIVIAKVDEEVKSTKNNEIKEILPVEKSIKNKSKNRIIINSDDLLYAVTHSAQEVKAYYAKNNVTRDEVLNTIKRELKKSEIKINPNTILAEVERTIDEDDFQNNFMKSLKSKISDIATVIASRNH